MRANIYNRTYYIKNLDQERNRNKTRAKKFRVAAAHLIILSKSVPCADCRKSYGTYVMQFDHVRGVKLFNISQVCGRQPLDVIAAEIAKCDVVCANCHFERTHQRRQAANDLQEMSA